MNRESIVEECIGCSRIYGESLCKVYISPKLWWEYASGCPMATHLQKEEIQKQKINPLKASKKQRKK